MHYDDMHYEFCQLYFIKTIIVTTRFVLCCFTLIIEMIQAFLLSKYYLRKCKRIVNGTIKEQESGLFNSL